MFIISFTMFPGAKIGTFIYIASDLSKALSLFNNKSFAILLKGITCRVTKKPPTSTFGHRRLYIHRFHAIRYHQSLAR